MKTNENYEFGISKIFLDKMFYSNTDKYEKWLVKIGGVVGLTNLLRTDLKKGISELEKTNIFLRKKVLDKWNLSKKITINDYHVYSSIFQSLMFFILCVFKAWQLNDEENVEIMMGDFIEIIGFFSFGFFFLITSFLPFNKFTIKPLNFSQQQSNFKVLRNGIIVDIPYIELLIGDILLIKSNQNLGAIGGILIEGEDIEIVANDNINSKKIRKNERIFQRSTILYGEGFLLICSLTLGKNESENDILYVGVDKLSKLLYTLEENSGIFGRLLAWITLMTIIIHCYFAGKMETYNFLDGISICIVICLLMNPQRLIWIMNFITYKYQRKIFEEFQIKLKYINSLPNVSHMILDFNDFIEINSLKIKYIANNIEIQYVDNENNWLKSINKEFKEKLIKSLSACIEQEINFMTNTEKSISNFLSILTNENKEIMKNGKFEKEVLETDKNYKMVRISNGSIYKIGQFEDIIEECSFNEAEDKFLHNKIYLDLQSKDVDKILALSVTVDGKSEYLGLIGFSNEKKNYSNFFERLKRFNIKVILLTEESFENSLNLKETIGVDAIKLNEEIFDENDQDSQSSLVAFESNQKTKINLIKKLKDINSCMIVSVNKFDSFLYDENDPSIIYINSEETKNNIDSMVLKKDSFSMLIKSLTLSKNLYFQMKNCLFLKIIISFILEMRLIFSVSATFKPFMIIFESVCVYLLLDFYLLIWVYSAKEITEENIQKVKNNWSFFIGEKDISKICAIVLFGCLISFLADFFIYSAITTFIIGIAFIIFFNKDCFQYKQLIIFGFMFVIYIYI